MPQAVRTVSFTVSHDTITPTTPQWAGVQGEHQATAVSFQLPADWVEAGYRFRVEYVDGMQSFFVSDFLTVTEGKVSCLLPTAWTAAGGTAEIRLIAFLDGSTAATRQIVYSQTGRLVFTGRHVSAQAEAAAANTMYDGVYANA